jgi:hypothetical protein
VVLVSHDHDTPISQWAHVVVGLADCQSKDLDDILHFWVRPDLRCRGFTHVQELSTEGEGAVMLPAYDVFYARECKRLGGVSFSQDQGA